MLLLAIWIRIGSSVSKQNQYTGLGQQNALYSAYQCNDKTGFIFRFELHASIELLSYFWCEIEMLQEKKLTEFSIFRQFTYEIVNDYESFIEISNHNRLPHFSLIRMNRE